jgi:hypothetical protein
VYNIWFIIVIGMSFMDYFWKKPKLEPMGDQHFLKCEFLTR